MKLTDEERNSLVILQLEKAKVFLKQADEMFDLKYWDIASNRYYLRGEKRCVSKFGRSENI